MTNSILRGLLFFFFIFENAGALACDSGLEICNYLGAKGVGAEANPSRSSSINLNPASVPVEDGFGIEGITYKGLWDFAIVKGTGRIGAAITPTNNEETIFGPPGFELDPDYLRRKIDKDKYVSQKVTLATAFSVLKNSSTGLDRFQINLGLMAKHNKQTSTTWPGAGLAGVMGPFTFGYSNSKDETLIDFAPYGLNLKYNFRYFSETYSVGMFLNSLALDYSRVNLYSESLPNMTITLLLGSVFISRWIITLGNRTEDSTRSNFDFGSQTLVTQAVKTENFVGIQFAPIKNLLLGGFYNYYLLREISLGATLFL